MNDGLMNWLQNPRQQGQPSAPTAPTTPEQAPNGKLLADMLRNKFHLDQMTPDMGGLGGVIGKFASPFLSFLEQANFGGKGRTPEGRAEIRARVGPRPYGKGNATGNLAPALAGMFDWPDDNV